MLKNQYMYTILKEITMHVLRLYAQIYLPMGIYKKKSWKLLI